MSPTGRQDSRVFAFRCGPVIREAIFLTVLAVVATAIAWAVRSDRLPLTADLEAYELEVAAPLLDIAEALVLFDEGDHLFIDTRSKRPDGSNTILGAFQVRAATFDDDLYELADTVYREDPIVLFGDGNLGGVAHVADLLLARGYVDISIMRGSVAAWLAAGGEISSFEPAPETAPEVGS
jgi:rhodanese-related sulfurtransferase